ncbi:MAG: hypothetical protein QOJ99_5156, partial [Bryobacterales bacterium]|nr:hypothetical protein [Bryobacterales bacterium]
MRIVDIFSVTLQDGVPIEKQGVSL